MPKPCLTLIEGFRNRAAASLPQGRPAVLSGGVKRRREGTPDGQARGGRGPAATRLYCPECGAKYRPHFGALLEVILHGVTYYWTAEIPASLEEEPYNMLGAFFHAALADPSILPPNWTMQWGPLIRQR